MDLQSLPWYGQLVVFLVIGAVMFGLFYAIYYSDTQGRIDTLDNQIEKLDTEIKKAEKKETQLGQIKAEKAEKEKVLENLKDILPEGKEISQILRKVQSIISGARLKMQKWDTQQDKPQQVYTEIPFLITVEGNYHNLGIFFDQLSKLKKIFTVSGLTITPFSPMTSLFSVRATFTASTYTYQEQPIKSAAPAKKKARPKPSNAEEKLE